MEEVKKTAKKRRRRAGSLEEARRLLWRALERAGELLEVETIDPETGEARPDNALALKAIHAISQGAGAYAKVCEVSDLAARIEAIEAAQGIDPEDTGPRLARVGA